MIMWVWVLANIMKRKLFSDSNTFADTFNCMPEDETNMDAEDETNTDAEDDTNMDAQSGEGPLIPGDYENLFYISI